jgi:hypothetical protein
MESGGVLSVMSVRTESGLDGRISGVVVSNGVLMIAGKAALER